MVVDLNQELTDLVGRRDALIRAVDSLKSHAAARADVQSKLDAVNARIAVLRRLQSDNATPIKAN